MIDVFITALGGLFLGLLIGLLIAIYKFPEWEVRKMYNFYLRQAKKYEWVHIRKFADHHNHEIVKPNCDTLYSFVFIDLASKNYRLTIPSINDRYVSFCFLSKNTDVLGYINYKNIDQGPDFRLTNHKDSSIDNLPSITLDTNLCWLVARIGVTGDDDIKKVNQLQDNIILRPDD